MFAEKNIQKKFEEIGAKVLIKENNISDRDFSVGIVDRKAEEVFSISMKKHDIELQVLQTRKDIRHLLLMAKNKKHNTHEKFLCGYDERHWFLVGVDDDVRNVDHAMASLKPGYINFRQKITKVKPKNINKRHNKAFIRQGEWFFLPYYRLNSNNLIIYKNHSLGGHICDEVYEDVVETYFHHKHAPDGMLDWTYKKFLKKHPHVHPKKGWSYSVSLFGRYARGHVRHKDHQTIYLNDWHIVLKNRQKNTPGNVFLD
jgi:hypothetical protein